MVRGIRGAITVKENEATEILTQTRVLFLKIVEKNQIQPEDVASIFLTVTPDLTAAFPAKTIREIKEWVHVPLMCAHEIDVDTGLKKCIRILVHWNTLKSQQDIHHVYLEEAKQLRLDLKESSET